MLGASSAASPPQLFNTHALIISKLNVRVSSFPATARESDFFFFGGHAPRFGLAWRKLSGLSVEVKEVFGRDEVHDGNSRSLNAAGQSQSAATVNISGKKRVKLHADVHRHSNRHQIRNM